MDSVMILERGVEYVFRLSAKNSVDYGEQAVETITTPDGSESDHLCPPPPAHPPPHPPPPSGATPGMRMSFTDTAKRHELFSFFQSFSFRFGLCIAV